MKNDEFISKLNEYSNVILNNQREFLQIIAPQFNFLQDINEMRIDEISFSATMCYVRLKDSKFGMTCPALIKIDEFMIWYDKKING